MEYINAISSANLVCMSCGAVVLFTGIHDEWHNLIDGLSEKE